MRDFWDELISAMILGAIAGLLLSTAIQIGMSAYHEAQMQVTLGEMMSNANEVP